MANKKENHQTPTEKSPTQSAQQIADKPQEAVTPITETGFTKPETPKKIKSRRPLIYYLPWTVGVLAATWITELLLVSVLGNTLRRQLTEAGAVKQQQVDEQQASQVLSENQNKITQLESFFPDEPGLINFVKETKEQISQFPESDLKISTNQPVQTKDFVAPLLPVAMSMTATPSAFTPLMEQLAQKRYLFQPVLLEFNAHDGLGANTEIEYKGNLFVAKELLQ